MIRQLRKCKHPGECWYRTKYGCSIPACPKDVTKSKSTGRKVRI